MIVIYHLAKFGVLSRELMIKIHF